MGDKVKAIVAGINSDNPFMIARASYHYSRFRGYGIYESLRGAIDLFQEKMKQRKER